MKTNYNTFNNFVKKSFIYEEAPETQAVTQEYTDEELAEMGEFPQSDIQDQLDEAMKLQHKEEFNTKFEELFGREYPFEDVYNVDMLRSALSEKVEHFLAVTKKSPAVVKESINTYMEDFYWYTVHLTTLTPSLLSEDRDINARNLVEEYINYPTKSLSSMDILVLGVARTHDSLKSYDKQNLQMYTTLRNGSDPLPLSGDRGPEFFSGTSVPAYHPRRVLYRRMEDVFERNQPDMRLGYRALCWAKHRVQELDGADGISDADFNGFLLELDEVLNTKRVPLIHS